MNPKAPRTLAVTALVICLFLWPLLVSAQLPVILDTTFDPGIGVNGAIEAMAVQPDGKTLIFGRFTHVQGIRRVFGARLNPDGSLDPAFVVTNISHLGAQFDPPTLPILLQPNGKVLVGYYFVDANNTVNLGLQRLNSDGTRDPSFNVTFGNNYSGRAHLALQNDGQLYVGGEFDLFNGATRRGLVRLNTNGTIDTTFNAGANAAGLSALALQSDGKVVLARNAFALGGALSNSLVRLNANGSLDTNFVRSGPWHANGPVFMLAVQPDGKILYAEESLEVVAGVPRRRLARLNSDGTLDTNFNAHLVAFRIRALNVLSDGRILLGGRMEFTDGAVQAVARLNPDGSRDPSFDAGIDATSTPYFGFNGPEPAIQLMALHPGGKLVLAGGFTEVAGAPSPGLARVLTDWMGLSSVDFARAKLDVEETAGSVTLSVVRRGETSTAASVNFATSNLTAQAGTEYTAISGALNFAVGETNKTVTVPILDNPVVDGSKSFVVALSGATGVSPGAGTTATVAIRDNERAVRVDQSLDPGLGVSNSDPFAAAYIFDIQTLSNGQMLVFGRFDRVQGQTRHNLARLNANGSLDTTFSTEAGGGLNGVVYEFAVQPDGKIVIGGDFTRVGTVARNRVARLNENGSLDTTFNPGSGANDVLDAVTLQPDGKVLIGGNFTTFAGVSRRYLARMNADGSNDTNFFTGVGLGGTPFPAVSDIAVQSDGKILVGGYFTRYQNGVHEHIVRLNPDGSVDTNFTASVKNSSYVGSTVSKIRVLGNGKLFVASPDFNQVNGVPHIGIARLNADGSLDTGFDARLSAFSDFRGLVPLPDGRVYFAGNIRFADGTSASVARFNEDGSRDPLFDLTFPGGQPIAELEVEPNGSVLISGFFSEVDGVSRAGLARLYPDIPSVTQVDMAEPVASARESGGPAKVTLLRHGSSSASLTVEVGTSDGTATAGSDYTAVATPVTFAPLETSKTVSVPILDDTVAETNETFEVLLSGLPAGVLGGRAQAAVSIQDDDFLTRVDESYNATLGLKPPPGGGLRPISVHVLAMQPDGKCLAIFLDAYAGGNPPPQSLVRLHADGTIDSTFPAVPGAYRVSLARDGKIFVAQDFGQKRLLLLNADGSQNAAITVTLSTDGYLAGGLPLADGTILVYGTFIRINGTSRTNLARLFVDGTVDTNFSTGTGPDSGVGTALLQSDGKVLIGGYFSAVGGVARRGIARLNENGTVDTTFSPGSGFAQDSSPGSVGQLLLQRDGKVIAIGYFNRFNNVGRNAVARLNNNGTLDATFSVGSGGRFVYEGGSYTAEPVAGALQLDGKILLIGGFNWFSGRRCPGLVRLRSDGSLDPAFGVGSGDQSGYLYTLALTPEGKIMVAGDNISFAGSPRSGLVRLNNAYDLVLTSLDFPSANRVQITALTQPGKIYTLQVSDDLANWGDRATRTATGTTLMLEDDPVPGGAARFYRVAQP